MLNWEDCKIKIKSENQNTFYFLAGKHAKDFFL